MKPGPKLRAVGEKGKPAGRMCLVLSGRLPRVAPPGYLPAAQARRFSLPETWAAAVITRDLWGPEVAPSISAVFVVSSVLLRVVNEGGPSFPDSKELSPRTWGLWQVNARTKLTAHVMQRWPGELYAVPLKVIKAEPMKGPALALIKP